MMYAQDEREYDNEHGHAQEMERPQSPAEDLPTQAAEVGMLGSQEQQQSDEPYTKERERQDAERFQSPTPSVTSELPTPARDVEMLNPLEQRQYDEEYAKELERQLGPPDQQESLYAAPSEAAGASVPEPSIGAVMQPPYEDVHRPLAQPPALEDIIEESRSRPGSVQESPAPPDRQDDFSPVTSTKKSKKGKRSKKQQQPIIWEDETATPRGVEEPEQVIDPTLSSSAVPGSWETAGFSQPVDLEEHIEQRPVEGSGYISPTRDLSSYRDSPKEHGQASDYFGLQPSRSAEENVGIEQADEDQQAMSKPLPQSTRDEGLNQSSFTERNDHRIAEVYRPREVDDMDQQELIEQQHQPRMVSSVEERSDDDQGFVSHSKGKKGKMSKRSLGLLPGDVERDSSSPGSRKGGLMDQPSHPKISTSDSVKDLPASPEPSVQRSLSFETEPVAIDKEKSTSEGRSRGTEGLATAAGLGIGALAAEGLARRDSKKEREKNKKARESSRWEDFEEESHDSGRPVNTIEILPESEETRPVSDLDSSTRTQQQSIVTPPQSPSFPTSYEPILTESADLLQRLGSPNVRDSAIHVSDSPIVSEEPPIHRAVRDSGYPETEPDPIVDFERQHEDTHTTRELEKPHRREPERVFEEYDHDYPRHERRESMPRDLINESVEADPHYDVSISRPNDRRRRSRRRSSAAYDSDDSNDSGFDIQRRRRMQAMKDEVREPSPVSSTTKERSSELFGSSPSARQEPFGQPQEQYTPSQGEHIREDPTWSFGPDPSPQARSRDASGETESTHPSHQVTDSFTYEKLTGGPEEPTISLFGGPSIHDKDTIPRSMSPPSNDARGRGRLNTISEELSPLHKKDKRDISDFGSPAAVAKEHQQQSPTALVDAAGGVIPTHDPFSRQPMPTHEPTHTMDIERSLSRNTDQSSRHSNMSNPRGVAQKNRDGGERKSSVASIHSDNSIPAIIRTPDQVRSASGQSFRSSGTPPLRRVDRSVSGDLRGASKKIEAKSRAKSSEEDPELDINIPSSSTYDPITDKGKSRADMADVYVSSRMLNLDDTRRTRG